MPHSHSAHLPTPPSRDGGRVMVEDGEEQDSGRPARTTAPTVLSATPDWVRMQMTEHCGGGGTGWEFTSCAADRSAAMYELAPVCERRKGAAAVASL
eukprot:gene12995-biopygen6089